jgi:hypothetical protein
MKTKIQDYRLKPLEKFYRLYFLPHFNSYEMDYALSNLLINNKKVYKYYLFVININAKFLFVSPVKNNTTPVV